MAHLRDQPAGIVPTTPPGGMLALGEPFTIAEAVTAGVSRKQLRRMLLAGLVKTVLTGVFIDSAAPDTLDLRAKALFKVAPANSVITDRTAAWLLGADILGPTGRDGLPPIDVFRSGGDTRLRRTGCRSGTRALEPRRDLTRAGGLITTTPLRTALDLGRLLRRYEAIGALDALMAVGGLGVSALEAELPRFKGARGVVQLRQLVPLADARAESPAESRSRLLLLDAGLPAPEVQWQVCNHLGVLVYRLDLAYPDLLLAVEYDGEQFHTSAVERAHDEQRRRYLQALGWTIVVLRKEHVYGPAPTAAARVRAARSLLLAP